MNEPTDSKPNYQFRLVHVMYVVAMISASMATFGADGGLKLGLIVCLFWTPSFVCKNRKRAFKISFLCLIFLLFLSLFIPTFAQAREAARRMQCVNNLKQLGIALHNYHDTYRTLPPAYIADDNGKPMHSWRVLILPFIEHWDLYQKYNFDEPWDGPNNKKLLKEMPDVYFCPSTDLRHQGHKYTTSYLAVSGENTIWPNEQTIRFHDIIDGTSNTIMLIECDEKHIPWMQPEDVELDEALNILANTNFDTYEAHQAETFFYQYLFGRNILFADGSVTFADVGVNQKVWRQFLERNDQSVVDHEDLHLANSSDIKRLRIDNCLRLAIFILLMFLPLPWVFRKPVTDE